MQHAARWAMENELLPDLNRDEDRTEEEKLFFPLPCGEPDPDPSYMAEGTGTEEERLIRIGKGPVRRNKGAAAK